jgi:branched-chain amino acid transport system substrate-binding protein
MIQKDKVIAILGPTSSRSTMPIIPLCNESQTPGIGISATNPSVTIDDATGNVHPYMFRVCFIDPYQGTALASFAYNDLEIKKVASLMRVNDPYAQGLVQFFKENFVDLGGELLEMGYQDKEVEFRAQLSQASDAGVEALFIPVTEYKDAAMIAKQADELGLKFTYLFPDGAYASELLDVAGKELEGAYISTGVSEDDPAFAEYKEAFNKKHESSGYTANIFAYYALDAIKLLEYAVNEAQSFEGEAIKDALENAKDVPLFTEPITIDPETHNPLNKTLNIVKVVDNKYELFRTYRPEE